MNSDTFGVSLGSLSGWAAGPALSAFVVESNRIEGLAHGAHQHEVDAHIVLLSLKRITVADMEGFVHVVAGAGLRRSVGQNVRVGPHYPPPGGPAIEVELDRILAGAHRGATAYTTHTLYEALHPFMDGNGRSGRALWAWQMFRAGHDPFSLGFLHRWYYDSLEAGR